MPSNGNIATMHTTLGTIAIRDERIDGDAYIEFLSRTDLGKQYPKERFRERIARLVKNAQISLVARDGTDAIVGVCFGLTDFAYWLLVTDLGIDRKYVNLGIGKTLMESSRRLAGGEKDIIVFVNANEEAIGFYEKVGMHPADSMMELSDVDWTEFEVGKDLID